MTLIYDQFGDRGLEEQNSSDLKSRGYGEILRISRSTKMSLVSVWTWGFQAINVSEAARLKFNLVVLPAPVTINHKLFDCQHRKLSWRAVKAYMAKAGTSSRETSMIFCLAPHRYSMS
ncbi:unnamed protein product [Macrosiphum euphorbiae]|uniref:Uncharacterized protein n=1 Tax=Macrosiphum euphorbiae TaxID=13131 RepID=A0AAV0W003_9HEMI|nr:unnamed protein product [Macrosiphum euphorbiae]